MKLAFAKPHALTIIQPHEIYTFPKSPTSANSLHTSEYTQTNSKKYSILLSPYAAMIALIISILQNKPICHISKLTEPHLGITSSSKRFSREEECPLYQ
jgi:hypothetical protein